MTRQIGLHHHADQPLEVDGRRPSELRARLRRIPDQMIDLRRSQQARIGTHVPAPVQTDMLERGLHQLPDRAADPGGDDVVARSVPLQHHPHRPHVVAREAPVAMRIQVAERKMVGEAELDPRHRVGHLPRHELQASPRRLVVEQNAGHREQIVALAIVHGDVVGERLGHPVGAAGMERRLLRLRRLPRLAEHLARRCLIAPNRGVHPSDRLEDSGHPLGVVLAGEHRLLPGRGHERHGREIVELVRLNLVDHAQQRHLVEQIRLPQVDTPAQVLDTLLVRRAQPSRHADHLVALLQQQLCQIGTVLARDPGNDGTPGH